MNTKSRIIKEIASAQVEFLSDGVGAVEGDPSLQ